MDYKLNSNKITMKEQTIKDGFILWGYVKALKKLDLD